MAGERILVVEDEADIRELISYNLAREGYLVAEAADGRSALEACAPALPDLALLDLMLPDMSGFEVLRRLRALPGGKEVPVIMVTARSSDSDVVDGLEAGADDYLPKPFSPSVLVARIRARLRSAPDHGGPGGGAAPAERPAAESAPAEPGRAPELAVLRGGGILLDPALHLARPEAGGDPFPLTAGEFAILEFLMHSPGWVFTRAQIIDAVKGDDYPVTDRSVDVAILGLRKKLGPWALLVDTVRGVGYRFLVPEAAH